MVRGKPASRTVKREKVFALAKVDLLHMIRTVIYILNVLNRSVEFLESPFPRGFEQGEKRPQKYL